MSKFRPFKNDTFGQPLQSPIVLLYQQNVKGHFCSQKFLSVEKYLIYFIMFLCRSNARLPIKTDSNNITYLVTCSKESCDICSQL